MGRLYIPLILSLLLCLGLTAAGPYCHRCDGTQCNCSGQSLTRVPTIPQNGITGLDLSFNNLQVIYTEDFTKCAAFKSLIMSYNRIKKIQDQAFFPLVNLERLDLSFNRLTDLSARWFEKLLSLRYLSLLGNEYVTLGGGHLFQTLKKLRTLHFGGPSLEVVRINDFAGLSGLEELIFHEKQMKIYEMGSLKGTGPASRVTLGLDGLFQNNQALARTILYDVLHPNTTLTFTNTRFSQGYQMSPFVAVREKGIRRLIFRNVSVTDVAFLGLLNQMSQSNLSFFMVESTKMTLINMYIPVSPHLNLDSLQEVVLKNVDIPQYYQFPALFFMQPILKVIRKLSIISSLLHTTPCITSNDLSKLEYMDVSGNLFHDWTLMEMMCGGQAVYSSLQTINLSRNYLKSLNSHLFTKLVKLENINLSGNTLHTMPEICHWPPNLRVLNLSSSHLIKATSCLPESLYLLDLSDNDLVAFTIKLPSLTELYISGNKLRSLPDGSLFPTLLSLFIQNSTLQAFSNWDLKAFNRLGVLEAGASTYVCSCAFVAFMTGDMSGHGVTLGDGRESYICDAPFEVRTRKVVDVQLSVFECHLASALAVLCLSILLVFLFTAGLCYKFNALWYMRMTWAWLRAKRRPVLKKGDICYDAFVSYSEKDSVWVEEHLIPELEHSQPPLQLCIHKRDFQPGGWIMDNIMDAIEKSHRTLFILSQHFVRSEWCKYELDYSHFRLFDHNCDTAVLILLEPFPKETIPKRFCNLRKFMNSRTYLEWPDDEEQIPRFWQSLREAIKRNEPTE